MIESTSLIFRSSGPSSCRVIILVSEDEWAVERGEKGTGDIQVVSKKRRGGRQGIRDVKKDETGMG